MRRSGVVENRVRAAAGTARPARVSRPLFVVGLGASAGGLRALKEFLQAMPADSGLAFVVVTHQPADHVSLLPELLARHTAMPVRMARDTTKIQANRVYVSAPGQSLTLADGRIRSEASPAVSSARRPIDRLFESMAEECGHRAVGIVLSGMGKDGTLGLRAIKARGGIALVQDEASSEHAGMPLSAASTGLADFVVPPGRMAEHLLASVRLAGEQSPDGSGTAGLDASLGTLFGFIESRTGHDFSGYKRKTIQRRVERRMRTRGIQTSLDYLALLRSEPREIDVLSQELLVGVTRFFRDDEAFTALEGALHLLIARKPEGSTLRIWVPGCSTGEEAYSIAMLVSEILRRTGKPLPVQIFATDLHAGAVHFARAGRYPESAFAELGSERVERYFVKDGDGRRFRKEHRSMLVFAVQNVIKDPPFIKLDVVSCRNLLIYVEPGVQARIFRTFYDALNPGGLLFLGTSESVSTSEPLFLSLEPRWKLYERASLPVSTGALGVSRGANAPRGPGTAALPSPTRARRRSTKAGDSPPAQKGKQPGATKKRSAREELTSTTQELQSATEQLETSREELQSLNEELQTVNAELHSKVDELSRSHEDLQNLLNATDIATLFLDAQLRIKGFTPRVRDFVGVLPGDIGRPVHDLASLLHYDDLTVDASAVLQTGNLCEREVQSLSGERRLLRISPYRTAAGAVDGVVVTCLDVDRVKRAELVAASLE